MALNAGPDSLIFQISAAEVKPLAAVGTVSGVAISFVSGSVGPGSALLAYTNNLTALRFRAPGSASFGEYVEVSGGGDYIVADGENRSKYIRVTVTPAKLPESDSQSLVFIQEMNDNSAGGTPATAAQAAAGQVLDYFIDIYNQSNFPAQAIVAWIDPLAGSEFQISNDNATWVSPKTEAVGISIANIAPAGTGVLYIRRTIAAGAAADPDLLSVFRCSYTAKP